MTRVNLNGSSSQCHGQLVPQQSVHAQYITEPWALVGEVVQVR